MQLNGKREDFEELIQEIEDFIADRKLMISSCISRINKVQSDRFSQFGKEYVEKRIHEENDLINRITKQIISNEDFLRELKDNFNKQFN